MRLSLQDKASLDAGFAAAFGGAPGLYGALTLALCSRNPEGRGACRVLTIRPQGGTQLYPTM